MLEKFERLAHQQDEELFQPIFLLWGLVTTKTMADSIKKFVELRRKYRMYVNMAVLTPHIVDSADQVMLYDHEGNYPRAYHEYAEDKDPLGTSICYMARVGKKKAGFLLGHESIGDR